MKKLVATLLLSLFLLATSHPTFAADAACAGTITMTPPYAYSGQQDVVFNINGNNLPDGTYTLELTAATIWTGWKAEKMSFTVTNHVASPNPLKFNDKALANTRVTEADNGYRAINIIKSNGGYFCNAFEYLIKEDEERPISCKLGLAPTCIDISTPGITVVVSDCVTSDNRQPWSGKIGLSVGRQLLTGIGYKSIDKGGSVGFVISPSTTPAMTAGELFKPGNHTLYLMKMRSGEGGTSQQQAFTISTKTSCKEGDTSLGGNTGGGPGITNKAQCCIVGTGDSCADSTPINDPARGIKTAIGCVPTNIAPFISWGYRFILGIAGGITFLLLVWGSFQLITSTGDPQKLGAGKDTITSAVAGLLFILFSIFLLFVITGFIEIPGFER